jgi:peptide/nickel transport system permease protein
VNNNAGWIYPAERAAEEKDNSQTPSPLLNITDLHVTFSVLRGNKPVSVHAVRGVSFTLNKGECLGIVGESGSGKSVSTLAIPGLLPHNAGVAGSIRYDGKELLGLAAADLREYRGKKIGMIFQEPGRSFDPLQNMGSVFFETFKNSEPDIDKEKAFEQAAALLAETGLERGRERLGTFPHQFSGGQLQRIGIALALAQHCELLIADEPTTALDVTIQKQIVELLQTLRRSRGISIIFISHDIELVAEISDRIMVMYGGMLMESAAAADIIGSPQHPYTKALLASSPRFGSHYSQGRLPAIPGKVSDPAENAAGCPFAPRCSQAQPECFKTLPPLVTADGHELRCLRKK